MSEKHFTETDGWKEFKLSAPKVAELLSASKNQDELLMHVGELRTALHRLQAAFPNEKRDRLVRAAQNHEKYEEGVLEVDDGALISDGGDPGAYVQAWLWVYYTDAGLTEDGALPEEAAKAG